MSRIVALMLVLGFSFAVVALGWAAEANTEQAKAITEIERLGVKVTVDEKSPDKPVIGLDLHRTQMTDAGLEHLHGLTQLRVLDLWYTQVTDKGAERLQQVLRNCSIIPLKPIARPGTKAPTLRSI